MADPVSLLGTLPALVTLPAVFLQAVQTIQNFSTSMKNASADVRQLLKEVEAMQALIQDIRAQCDQATAQDVEHDTLQDFLKVTGLLKERMEGPLKELQGLHAGMEKPSRTSRKIVSRVRKYLSEGEVKDHLDHLLRQMITLQLLYQKENDKRVQLLLAKTDTMQRDLNRLALRFPDPSDPSTNPLQPPTMMQVQLEELVATRPFGKHAWRNSGRSRCVQGLCGCPCHRISTHRRGWLVSGSTACMVACGCEDRRYQWIVSLFGKLIRITAGIREGGNMSIGWGIMPLNTVRRTSPGFVVIEKCMAGTLTASDASRQLRTLLASGVISTKDQNPDGKSYIDYLLRVPWLGLVDRQFDLLKTFAQEGFLWESDKLLRRLLKWVGEGPHMCLLEEVLGLFDFTQGFRPETMTEWPIPFNTDWLAAFTYPDLLFVKAIGMLAAEDPDFGGTTPLHAKVLSQNFEATEAIMRSVSLHDLRARNFRGQCALHLAVRNPDMVRLLLDSGYSAHIDSTDRFGMTPLMYAVGYGDIESTKTLLLAGANPYQRDELYHMCIWHYALFCHKREFLQEVLDAYETVSPETVTSAIELCLWIRMINHAAYSVDVSCNTLEYLLQVRATQRNTFYDGVSLLHLCRNTDEADLLLKYCRGGMDQQSDRGYTPMMVLAHFSAPADALQALIEHEADVSIVDNHGMSALHHLDAASPGGRFCGGSNKDGWTNWLDATAVLLSAGADINAGDGCCCPCSSAGCPPMRGLLSNEDGSFVSDNTALHSIPWILELVLVLKHSGSDDDALVQTARELHRSQKFDEWGMTHTCYVHCDWYFGPRPTVSFHPPCDEPDGRDREDSRNYERRRLAEWDEELAEITSEQEELRRNLDSECAKYNSTLNGPFEDRWVIEILARRVVLLEHKAKARLAKAEKWNGRAKLSFGPELPPKELLISESPLMYIDKSKDLFCTDSVRLERLSKRENCEFERYYACFVDHFATDSQTYRYMGGQSRQAWDSERQKLLSSLYEEIRRFRNVPLEARDWDVDLE